MRNEVERLRTLRLYNIIDTQAEQAFDDLARLAAAICETPIGLVSIVDESRQWFKARVGLDVPQTPRDVAFCAHAIQQPDVFVVEDATKDSRFSSNPLVTEDPAIRFYAGAPLVVADGSALGTLCVIDRQPRRLTSEQLDALTILRRSVVAQLELRRAVDDLRNVGRLLSMCAWCRNVRTDSGAWLPLHRYVMKSSEVSHGLCPECERTLEEGGAP